LTTGCEDLAGTLNAMLRLRIAVATALAVAVLPAGAAATQSIATQLLNEYSQTGTINPCQFSSAQLNDALKSVDLYAAQYFSDFPDAIQAALANRASGGCSKSGLSLAGLSSALAGSRGGPTGLHPGPLTAATDAPLPAPIVIMAALAGAFVLIAAAIAVSRARGWDPRWAASTRHSLGEAGYRLGGALDEFRDRRRDGG
jgi:hypothetical protein